MQIRKASMIWFGAAREIGRTMKLLLVETTAGETHGVVMDCGSVPSAEIEGGAMKLPDFELFKPYRKYVRAIIVSHGHGDHVLALPLLVESDDWDDPVLDKNVQIYLTPPTGEISQIWWKDSRKLALLARRPAPYPITAVDEAIMRLDYVTEPGIVTLPFGLEVGFWPNRHVRGSVTFVFPQLGLIDANDTYSYDRPLLAGDPGPNPWIAKPRVYITEATNGSRNLPDLATVNQEMGRDIRQDILRSRRVLAGSLAFGRSQELLEVLSTALRDENGQLICPLYLDGMVRRITRSFADPGNKWCSLDRDFTTLEGIRFVDSKEDSQRIIEDPRPKVVIASSGMYVGGASVAYADAWIEDPNVTILQANFMAPGTGGRLLRELTQGQHIRFPVGENGELGERRALNATVRVYEPSGHDDQKTLANTVAALDPERTILNHAEPEAMEDLRNVLHYSRGYNRSRVEFAEHGKKIQIYP